MTTEKPWNIGPVDKTFYMIKSKDETEFMESPNGKILPLFWSNDHGWVLFFYADRWTNIEYFEVDLPQEGVWVQVDCISNYTAMGDHYVCHDIYQLTSNPVVYPDWYDSEKAFRVI